MRTHNVQQGTNAWHALRAGYFTASEASAMMGVSKYATRADLLKKKATGIEQEVNEATQALFARGHATEEKARVIAEKIIGEDLYPATVTDDADYLLASLDGMTMDDSIIFEHKLLNQDLLADVIAGKCPDCHYWQVAQALVITGAEKCMFAVSDGTEENFHYVWVTLGDGDGEKLMAGWRQFEQDVANYQHVEVAPKLEGKAPEQLPALRIEVKGMVTASNIDVFRDHAMAVFQGINRDLQTDGDFANAEKTVKWCSEVESKLAAAKQHALSQTADIDALFRAIDEISEEARRVRLDLDKLVKARKDSIRVEINQEHQAALNAHIQAINARLTPVFLPQIKADFAAAMKGKKTVQSLRDACDAELARAKIEASQIGDAIGENLRIFEAAGAEHGFLFRDLQQIITMPLEAFKATVDGRVTAHKAQEAARLEAERERIRKEEEERAARKAQEVAAPAPEPVQIQEHQSAPAVATPEASPAPVAERVTRPTDAQIIQVVADAFGTDVRTAAGWIKSMNGGAA